VGEWPLGKETAQLNWVDGRQLIQAPKGFKNILPSEEQPKGVHSSSQGGRCTRPMILCREIPQKSVSASPKDSRRLELEQKMNLQNTHQPVNETPDCGAEGKVVGQGGRRPRLGPPRKESRRCTTLASSPHSTDLLQTRGPKGKKKNHRYGRASAGSRNTITLGYQRKSTRV